MRIAIAALLLAAPASIATVQIPSQCISGCVIPNPQRQRPQSPQIDPRFIVIGVTAGIQGDVTYVYPNGERIKAAAGTPIVLGARVITAPGAKVQFLLLDETTFTVGPVAETVIDRFVYDPTNADVSLKIAKGNFRWVSGKSKPAKSNINVRIPVGNLGIRGTDLEINIDPAGSGSAYLREGEVSFEEYDTGRTVTMHAGQTLRYEDFKIVGVQ